ncbi:hypothetical protein [Maribacter polysaccharolyticus]
MTNELGGHTYMNPVGGTKMYDKDFFKCKGIK